MSYRIDRPEFYPNKTLRRAFEEMPESPCERGEGCQHSDACGTLRLACSAFQYYCNSGRVGYRALEVGRVNPNRSIYNKIFNGEKED
jgi:hypothetical protein